jgi:hypothetical protein
MRTIRGRFVDLPLEAGAIYLMDRGYVDFERLHRFTDEAAFFLTRTKKGIRFRRRTSRSVDFATGLQSDHTVGLVTAAARRDCPAPLRRVRYVDSETKKPLGFLTNNFALPAITIAHLYESRWHAERFFKWIKQHLRIKALHGTSENAVKTKIWTALSVDVLVAIVKQRLGLDVSLYKLLQILSVTLFEEHPFLLMFLTSATNSTGSTSVTNCNYSTYDRTLVPPAMPINGRSVNLDPANPAYPLIKNSLLGALCASAVNPTEAGRSKLQHSLCSNTPFRLRHVKPGL